MREGTAEVAGADAQTAEENGLSFFHGFLEFQYKSVLHGVSCVDVATKLFQSSAFISRAQTATVDLLNGDMSLNLPAVRELVTKV